MERRGITAAELSRQTGADKGQISRWLDGAAPGEKWQDALRQFFHTGREGIFRHPDDDWLTQFFEGRKREEIERIKQTMEMAFPKKVNGGLLGTD
jgi:transcriptional regulator with XRE-family HTH domain